MNKTDPLAPPPGFTGSNRVIHDLPGQVASDPAAQGRIAAIGNPASPSVLDAIEFLC